MLKITVKEFVSEQRWILQGKLTVDSVDGLLSNWRTTLDHSFAKHRVVDLNDVVVIDKSGEEVLSAMILEGVTFLADGLYTTHLLKSLRERIGSQSSSD
jgi:ABC-type transporter Mla MlaB component